jgi:hypothetical protein
MSLLHRLKAGGIATWTAIGIEDETGVIAIGTGTADGGGGAAATVGS